MDDGGETSGRRLIIDHNEHLMRARNEPQSIMNDKSTNPNNTKELSNIGFNTREMINCQEKSKEETNKGQNYTKINKKNYQSNGKNEILIHDGEARS